LTWGEDREDRKELTYIAMASITYKIAPLFTEVSLVAHRAMPTQVTNPAGSYLLTHIV
jgi:hypothetical protein